MGLLIWSFTPHKKEAQKTQHKIRRRNYPTYLEHVSSNDYHEILVDDNEFHLRGRLLCGRDSHLRERLLEYKCEVKSHIE